MAAGARPLLPLGPQPTLRGDRIVLGPFEARDVPAVAAWDTDRETQRWFDWPASRPDGFDHAADARRTVASKRAAWSAGEALAFVIRETAAGPALGWCDLHPRAGAAAAVSFGLVPAARGRGLATRAVALLARYAFETLGLARLEAEIAAENGRSRAVAVRAGFREAAVVPAGGRYGRFGPRLGERFDIVRYVRDAPVPDGRSDG